MKNLELLNASAGSGKTYNLTSRVVNLLNGGLAPEELMATTFTNRAAAELKERIRVQLLKNQQTEEAGQLDDGFVGTVNSICARLLKEYALEAGMSPAIDVLPEEDGRRIFRIAVDSVINQHADYMEPAAQRLELDGRGRGFQATADWRDNVKKIVDLARGNQISPSYLKTFSDSSWTALQTIFGAPLTTDPDRELQSAIALAINHLDHLDPLTKKTQSALETLKDCEKCFSKNRMTWSNWVRLAKLSAARDGQDIVDPVNAIADQVLNHPQFQADVKQMIEGTFSCAMQALQNYEAYKQNHGLMDFTDQETRVLDMAQHNEPFRSSMRDRIQMLMVDEFQDTSPIQLALFLSLHELAEKSIWVGDPKQAIYGFRGTDPQLMDEVVELIGNSQILDCSWRSKENLLNLTNALFSEVFHEMGKDKVCLKVPPERAEKAKGGELEAWHLTVKNNTDEALAVANGVRDLIERSPEIKPGDIAVLCRTNDSCKAIAANLENLGVRVSVGQGSLIDTRECRMSLAALRYMNNRGDTIALAELIQMTAQHLTGEDWLTELMSDPENTKKKWCDNPLITALNEGRSHMKYWTPLEALEQAISRIGLLRVIKSWPSPSLSRSNLDALRGVCHEYLDQCSSRRSAATVDGFVTYLKDAGTGQAQGTGEQTVQLLTYHGSKGLEWPWVVLTGLDTAPRADIFGVHIEAALQFNPTEPLANRKIRYWPWPFGAQKQYPLLDGEIDALPIKKYINDMTEREVQRLLYVGMTRAKDGMVLAIRKTTTNSGDSLKTGWLDALKNARGESVITWSNEIGCQTIQVGAAQIPIAVFEYGPESNNLPGLEDAEDQYMLELPSKPKDYCAARVAPSSLTETNKTNSGAWQIVEKFNSRISIKGNPEMDALGNSVHAYLACDYECLASEEQLILAERILKNWGMDINVPAADVVAAGQRLAGFLELRYPGHTANREWPMSLRNAEGQLIQGWIDLLLETSDGYVIIDHKSYPGQDSEEHAKKYAPQLIAYKEAVEKATGKPVIEMLLHLPVSGQILRLLKITKNEYDGDIC